MRRKFVAFRLAPMQPASPHTYVEESLSTSTMAADLLNTWCITITLYVYIPTRIEHNNVTAAVFFRSIRVLVYFISVFRELREEIKIDTT